MSKTPIQCASCNTTVAFTDNDLLLGSKPYNHPLFMASYIKEQKFDYILVDRGSVVNSMSKSTKHDLVIRIKELSKSRTMT